MSLSGSGWYCRLWHKLWGQVEVPALSKVGSRGSSHTALGRPSSTVFALAALVALGGAAPAQAAPDVYRVEPGLTSAEFAFSHLGLAKQHGRFGRTQGTIVLDPEQHTGSIELSIDATSIDTGWSLRDDFLRGRLMFDVARYPVVRFRSTEIVFGQTRLIGVAGELTVHNVTRPIALGVERLECDRAAERQRERCGATVAASIRRSDFGMDFASWLVGDDIELSFRVTAFRESEGP